MPIAETAKLMSSLELDTRKFDAGVGKASKGLQTLSTRSIAAGTAIGIGLERLAEKGISAVGSAITDGLNSLADLETASTANAAAIKQVGLAGQVTADQIAQWSVQIETAVNSAFDDKAINAAAGTLIRFGHVSASNLKPALVVMTDLATKTGDIDSAATLLAKALADPAKAAGKLARSGVILTKQQQDQIKAFVKSGKTAQAQKVILDALSKTTAGAAKASQGPYKESLNQLRDAYEEVTKALAVGFLPVITRVRDLLSKALANPAVLAGIKQFGENIAGGLTTIVDALQKVDWSKVGAGIMNVFSTLSSVVGAIKAGWDQIPDQLKQLLISGIVADRTMKFLFGFSPASFVISGVEGAVSASIGKAVGAAVIGAGLGKAFVQPVFVTNPGFATGGGGVPGAAGAGGAGLVATAAALSVGVLGVLGLMGGAQQGAQQVNDTRGTNFRVPAGFLDIPTMISNLGEAIKILTNNTSVLPEVARSTSNIGGDIEALRGVIAQQAKTPDVAAKILAAGAQRDAETSASISTLVDQQAKAYQESLEGHRADQVVKYEATLRSVNWFHS